jgi:hypothetical protein
MVSMSAESDLARKEPSWLVATTFAGLATGFITFWLTLVVAYSIILSSTGALIVWFFARGLGGEEFAERATVIFLVSIVIGVSVGVASSFGSGVPIALL